VKATFRGFLVVGVLDTVWFVGGLIGANWGGQGRWPLAVAIGLIGLTTFLGVLLSGHTTRGTISINDGETRTAITATMLVLYITILGMFSVSRYSPAEGSLARDLIDQFGTLLILVLGFYFGTSGAIQAFKIARGREDQVEETEEAEGQEEVERRQV
jgi:hypothetical protein